MGHTNQWMYATDVCALEIYHRMQHIEINFYIRYIMSRHLYSTPAAFFWWFRSNCKKRLGLLNFTWGSWKLCVGSPTVSNFSKLGSTPGPWNGLLRRIQRVLRQQSGKPAGGPRHWLPGGDGRDAFICASTITCLLKQCHFGVLGREPGSTDTYLCGMMCGTRRDFPNALANSKLQAGESVKWTNEAGLLIRKRHDKRDICVLDTNDAGGDHVMLPECSRQFKVAGRRVREMDKRGRPPDPETAWQTGHLCAWRKWRRRRSCDAGATQTSAGRFVCADLQACLQQTDGRSRPNGSVACLLRCWWKYLFSEIIIFYIVLHDIRI